MRKCQKIMYNHKIHKRLDKASKGNAQSQIINADKKLKNWHYRPTMSLGPPVEVRLQSLSIFNTRRRQVLSVMHWLLYTQKKSPLYSLDRRLAGS
jgi:hypothetical protein